MNSIKKILYQYTDWYIDHYIYHSTSVISKKLNQSSSSSSITHITFPWKTLKAPYLAQLRRLLKMFFQSDITKIWRNYTYCSYAQHAYNFSKFFWLKTKQLKQHNSRRSSRNRSGWHQFKLCLLLCYFKYVSFAVGQHLYSVSLKVACFIPSNEVCLEFFPRKRFLQFVDTYDVFITTNWYNCIVCYS